MVGSSQRPALSALARATPACQRASRNWGLRSNATSSAAVTPTRLSDSAEVRTAAASSGSVAPKRNASRCSARSIERRSYERQPEIASENARIATVVLGIARELGARRSINVCMSTPVGFARNARESRARKAHSAFTREARSLRSQPVQKAEALRCRADHLHRSVAGMKPVDPTLRESNNPPRCGQVATPRT